MLSSDTRAPIRALSTTQRQFLQAVATLTARSDGGHIPPTLEELRDYLDAHSKGHMADSRDRLARRGLVRYHPYRARSLLLTEAGEQALALALALAHAAP
jgi:Mn-dependent DtxR family transcriptional regulator